MALLFIINIIAFAVVFYAALCWGNHAAVKNWNKLDELAKRGVSGRGTWVGGHGALWRQCWRGAWGGRCKPSSVKPGSLCTGLCLLRGAIDLIVAALCGAECFQRSFILAAIGFYNAHCLHKCDSFFCFFLKLGLHILILIECSMSIVFHHYATEWHLNFPVCRLIKHLQFNDHLTLFISSV